MDCRSLRNPCARRVRRPICVRRGPVEPVNIPYDDLDMRSHGALSPSRDRPAMRGGGSGARCAAGQAASPQADTALAEASTPPTPVVSVHEAPLQCRPILNSVAATLHHLRTLGRLDLDLRQLFTPSFQSSRGPWPCGHPRCCPGANQGQRPRVRLHAARRNWLLVRATGKRKRGIEGGGCRGCCADAAHQVRRLLREMTWRSGPA